MKKRHFWRFFALFLQLTIRPLQRFFIIYLLFPFFCRNFAVEFVTNSRGKSESSGSPTKLASNVGEYIGILGAPDKTCKAMFWWGKSEARVALMSAERSVRATALPTIPFRSIEPLSREYRSIIERITKLNPHMQPVGDNGLQAFFDILKLPLRGGSLPNVNGK